MTTPYSPFTGQGGSVSLTIGSAVVYAVKEWNLELSCEAIDVTDTGGGGFKQFIGSPLSGTGTMTIIMDATTLTVIPSGTVATACQFNIGSTGAKITLATATYLPNTILITKANYKNSAAEDVEVELSFEFSGQWTYTS